MKACLFFFLLGFQLYGQVTTQLEPSFFNGRRDAFRALMPKNSYAVIHANTPVKRANDFDYPFFQNPNYYYLTGIDEPNGVLFIFSTPLDGSLDYLFVSARDPKKEMWTGRILGMDSARAVAGITKVSTKDSLIVLQKMISKSYFCLDSALVINYLARLRSVKTPQEIYLIQQSIDYSIDGHLAVMNKIHPDMAEYEAQALIEYNFKYHGAETVAYGSIVASGPNACTLHYDKNIRTMKDGELLLMDCGAEYHHYCADITRTIPVNGKFNPEQLAIYNLVLAAQDSAIAVCQPGIEFASTANMARRIIASGLKQLGIIESFAEYKKYFMHGTSHFMGLEVHDVGEKALLEVGNVITVEPGIYIPAGSPCDPKWWNIGVRLEDDILITPTGHINMSSRLPRAADTIELLHQH